jgi:1-hydroxycarotenoid 3,4-desaturase
VLVFEADQHVGGKLRQEIVAGQAIDAGPTVFTMRPVFEAIFAQAGVRIDDVLGLQPLEVLARHAWSDGPCDQLDLFTDPQRSAHAIARFSSPTQAKKFLGFCAEARSLVTTLKPTYLDAGRPSFFPMVRELGPRGLSQLAALGPFASLWKTLGRHFTDPRLRQLFARYATYCGSSPFLAPATLMLIAQVEMDGVWSVNGGMHALAQALASQALRWGATIDCNTPISEIVTEGDRAAGVRLTSGETVRARCVVFNGDSGALARGLLGNTVQHASPPVVHAQRSLSALTWATVGRTSGLALERHNVFFQTDYASEFTDIFKHSRLPATPTVYVCAQDRPEQSENPLGNAPQRLFMLVNAPPVGDQAAASLALGPQALASSEASMLALLRSCGLQLEIDPASVRRTSPIEFAQRFPATGGSLYGRATHSWMDVFRRPAAQTPVKGLILAGGSAHPGAGVPMAALSGRLAAEAAMAHLASTPRFHPVAISGGTSTPSVMTAGSG